jgi:hypothetical protein
MIDSSESPPSGLASLSDDDWLSALDDIGEDRGYFEPLGARHAAVFSDRGPNLLVTFESRERIRARASHLPLGFDLGDPGDWSQLALVATGPTWFRDARVYGYVDRLTDDGFFEDFDRVLFYGSGMGGYAAAAFSVAAPGATVLALSPQATLSPDLAGWDRRWPATRRLSFTDRYGYAPAMIDAAARAFVLYDPEVATDRVHASHFIAPHVSRHKLRWAGRDVEATLSRMGLLPDLVTAAMSGSLDGAMLHRAWRARRDDETWLRTLAGVLERSGRVWRLAKATRSVADRTGSRRFRRLALAAEKALKEAGRALPDRRGQAAAE